MTQEPIPTHAHAVWENGQLMNKDATPLWSGKGAVPAVGAIVPVGRGLTVRVEGYKVTDGWLMLVGERSDGKRGDLAGAEIAWALIEKAERAAEIDEMMADPNYVGSPIHY